MGILFKRKSNNTYTVPSQLQYGEPAIAPNGELFVGDYSGRAVSVMPTGAIIPFATTTIPRGWLVCNGQTVSRATYAALYAVIGTRYGAGNGSTTFQLPNINSRFVYGGTNPGATGGTATNTISVAQLPTHTPRMNVYNNDVLTGGTSVFGQTGGSSTNPVYIAAAMPPIKGYSTWKAEFAPIGSGQAVNNLPPYISFNFIIKY